MLFGGGERARRRGVSGIPSSFDVELFANPADVLWLVIDNREHPAQEEEIAGLHCLDVSAEGRRGGGELNAEFLQPTLRIAWL